MTKSSFNSDEANQLNQQTAGDQDLEDTYIPPDKPFGVNAVGVTVTGSKRGETISDRHDHGLPDVFEEEFNSPQKMVGQLVAESDLEIDSFNNESKIIAIEEDLFNSQEMSAEEAAMHHIVDTRSRRG